MIQEREREVYRVGQKDKRERNNYKDRRINDKNRE